MQNSVILTMLTNVLVSDLKIQDKKKRLIPLPDRIRLKLSFTQSKLFKRHSTLK